MSRRDAGNGAEIKFAPMSTIWEGLMAKRKKSELPMIWERGYRCHTLWQGDKCIGRVELGASGTWDEVYRCRAGTTLGEAKSLAQAKRWVTEMARLDGVQQKLF